MKVLIFEISGEFAHFKPYDTTSTKLSYPFPTPPTVLGMIGAILGLSKQDQQYLKILNDANTKVAVSILNPVKKLHWGLNLLNTKGNIVDLSNGHTQVLTEFIKDARYRIIVSMEKQDLYNSLKERLEKKESYYDLCLGITECLADFEFVGEYEASLNKYNSIEVDSVIPIDESIENKIDFTSVQEKITMPRIPYKMEVGRIASYRNVLVNEGAKPIAIKNIECYTTDVCNFLFLN